MGTTPTLGFPFPNTNDPADLNYWNQQLAQAIEAEFNRRGQYGEVVQGNYTKSNVGLAVLPLNNTGNNKGPNQTGISYFADGFSLPSGHWEVGYDISFGTSSPNPGSTPTSEHQAYITLAGSEVPSTHAYQGNGGNRGAHFSGRSMFSVGTDSPRVRLVFGSPETGSYIVPNGCHLWFKRIL